MDAILHILGVCGDSHSHIDLLDAFLYGATAATPMAILIKLKFRIWLDKWKNKKIL